MSNKIIFITGGARSGKSSFALKEALKISGKKAYIATAEALDDEMKDRVEMHKKDRVGEWDTYEVPVEISKIINEIKDKYDVIVIDCLTLWLSNVMLQSAQSENAINEFLQVLSSLSRSSSSNRLNGFNGLNLFIVSNEVGMGIVPDNEMARKFRDIAGFVNQKVAETADEVYLVTAGIPIKIKNAK
ncbi:MAG: bifunctional adenosylcobinamide kinase/adenosylcobinamide-phosphate guanylyltransferase [Nitrospirae bacterium]|nr:bifunctional adenosylcobinamide kinase/adenosylcobinamide-phosphate guanylyltransferase [Nitrospirota bacterium]